MLRPAHPLLLAALLGLGAPACSPPAVAPTTTLESTLADCTELQPAPEVRSWECGGLVAVETLVLSVEARDLELAFDGFEQSFGGKSPRRIDSVYTAGDAKHTAMRLEGQSEQGAPVEAHMVAVSLGDGVKLVTCSSKDPAKSCGPVIAELVQELAVAKRQRTPAL